MLAQHPRPVANRRQIELRIGRFQLVDEPQQRLGLRGAERDAEFPSALEEQVALAIHAARGGRR